MMIYPSKKIGEQYTPIIKIKLRNKDKLKLELEELGVLDTGSDVTLVPFTLTSKLELLRASKRKTETFNSVGRKNIIGIPYRLNFSLDNKNFFTTKILGCEEEYTEGIIVIGLNILNRFSITFDGINKQITIDS